MTRLFLFTLCILSSYAAQATEELSWKTKAAHQRAGIYAPVKLTADLSVLSKEQKQMLPLLLEAADIMDDLFWQQAYGNRAPLLNAITDPSLKQFTHINYGPWDRLADDSPFIKNIDQKPLGAHFYPADITKAEFEKWDSANKASLYTLVERNQDKLVTIPYHNAYKPQLEKAASLLTQASNYAESPAFKYYLRERAKALVTDDYQQSDMLWMDMKGNRLDIVIGPIETYEDRLFGYKAAYEAYVLLKDQAWSKKLEKYVSYLPTLQKGLPVPKDVKSEEPGSNSDLFAYDVLYYAGHSNAGSKTIAINLPNDETVQLLKGSRRLQLKNAMKAKFDKILKPIANTLIDDKELKHVSFDAFFNNTMFHEVAHGLGIKNTINNKGTVHHALKEIAGSFEEGKADILGLYMIQKLRAQKVITEGELKDNYVTFLAGMLRSIRFGGASAHGQANLLRFNYFKEHGAFVHDATSHKYHVNMQAFQKAVEDLSREILMLQAYGNYPKAQEMLAHYGGISATLQHDLDELEKSNIPVDIRFIQGKDILNL